MAQNIEEIAHKWYNRLQPQFIRMLTKRYPGLTLADAEDLYQDTFIAIQENLQKGAVREDTSWECYVLAIGLRLANKKWRKIGNTDSVDDAPVGDDDERPQSSLARKVENILKTLPDGEGNTLYDDSVSYSILGDELAHTPETCFNIISLFYYDSLSMEEIAERVGLKNVSSVKSRKFQCMKDLIRRVSAAFKRAGFDISPKKRNRNGKN